MDSQANLQLCDLPNDVLIHVFSQASTSDVLSVKQANRRLLKVVEQHGLGKPKVDEFSVEVRTNYKRSAQIGRIQMKPSTQANRRIVVTMKRRGKVKQVVEESDFEQGYCKSVVNQLKKIESTYKLSFDGISIDSNFVQSLLSKPSRLRSVRSLILTLCRVELAESEWTSLLSAMPLEELALDFCTVNSSLLSDKILMGVSSLRLLRIQPRSALELPELSDSLLHHWAARKENVIQSLNLYNCTTAISTEGILAIIQSIPSQQKIDYDFGRIAVEAQNESHLNRVLLACGSCLSVKDDWCARRVEIRAQSRAIAFNLICAQPLSTQ